MSREARLPVDVLLDSLARLVLVVGKGGVGKTTCAAALALRSARLGGRTLLLSTDPAGTLADALAAPLGCDPTPIDAAGRAARGSLHAFQVDAAAERRRFLERWRDTIVTIIDRGTYLDVDDITGLVDAALPGADEVFAVLRLGELERTTGYDRVIVDTAPTGHTLRLLDLPRTFAATIDLLEAMQSKHRFMVRSLTRTYRADAADAFLAELRARTAALTQALSDPTRAAAILVTRLEPLIVAESERYAAELTASGIRVAAVIANVVDGGGPSAARVLGGLAAVAPGAARYLVPRLAPAPGGIEGLRRWGEAMREGRAARAERQEIVVGKRVSGRAAKGRRRPAPHESSPSPAHKLLAGSLTIVGGKGGVGKTTTACALAIEAATATPPVLLVSTDPAPSIADALGQPVGDVETPVSDAPGLTARQMDATAAFREFQRGYHERIDALFDAFVRRGVDASQDRAILRDLLALAPPGLDELYALASLGETLAEGRFARVVVDPAPTGHLLRLLEMPALALDWSHRLMRLMLKYRDVAGLGDSADALLSFARRTRRVGELLRDPAQSALVVVTLDEPLVRAESVRLVAATRAEAVDVRGLLWNRWTGQRSPIPLPVTPPVPQFVAPAATPPPVGAAALRAWAAHWREVPEVDG
ncbi:MAG: ArsA family ATPase [Gemmatimonadota bacterium]|nr:ArsA family ATPase [Gemmatimonadota bacterium]